MPVIKNKAAYFAKNSDYSQPFTMKVIKWAGAGASLLAPVYAHLITPKYEHGLPTGSEKCEYFGAGLRECVARSNPGFHSWWSRAQRGMKVYYESSASGQAGAGASLLDPVYAYLITPRYENGC